MLSKSVNRCDSTRKLQTWQLQLEVAGKRLRQPHKLVSELARSFQDRKTNCAEELKDAKEQRVSEGEQTRSVTNEQIVGG